DRGIRVGAARTPGAAGGGAALHGDDLSHRPVPGAPGERSPRGGTPDGPPTVTLRPVAKARSDRRARATTTRGPHGPDRARGGDPVPNSTRTPGFPGVFHTHAWYGGG